MVLYNCLCCNKIFVGHSCHEKRNQNKYCSKNCKHVSQISNIDNQLVYDLYFKEQISTIEISKQLNITRSIINGVFNRNNWVFRSRKEARLLYYKKNILSKKVFLELYFDKKLKQSEIGKQLKLSTPVVERLFKFYKIDCRNRSERFTGLSVGEKNHNWNGGISKNGYSYHFNKKLKEKIRKRDNYKCQICNLKQDISYRKLDVHHIDYNKENHKEDNLITLCQKCHLKTNTNRDYWYSYFNYIMQQKELKC